MGSTSATLRAMRSVSAVLAGAWLALLVGGCANILGLDGYGPEPDAGGSGPGGDPLGAPCEAGGTCESGFCSDELCCDQACDGVCVACDQDNLEGHCRPLPALETPIACAGVCDGGGSCLLEGGTVEVVGGPGDQRGYAVGAGEEGAFALAGQFDTGLSFAGMDPLPVFGGADGWVAAFSGSELLFERSVGGTGTETLYGVAMAPDGRVVAAGISNSPALNFAGVPRAFSGPGDPMVLSWDASGIEEWLAIPSQNGTVVEAAYAVAVDEEGRAWVGGSMADADNLGLVDGFVDVYDATGMLAYPAVRLGVDGTTSYVRAIAADHAHKRVIVAGTTDGELAFPTVTGAGVGPEPDLFLIMFDSSGTPLWGTIFVAPNGRAVPLSLAFDADGGFAVTGVARGTNVLGGQALIGHTDQSDDIFVASFTKDGDHRFSQIYPAPGDQLGRAVAYDASGRLLLAGDLLDAVEFGSEAPLLGVVGASDGYVARFTAEGLHLSSYSFGDVADQQIWGAATASDGTVRLVGFAGGAFDLFDEPVMPVNGTNDVLFITLPP